jgi:hypothetical protein
MLASPSRHVRAASSPALAMTIGVAHWPKERSTPGPNTIATARAGILASPTPRKTFPHMPAHLGGSLGVHG